MNAEKYSQKKFSDLLNLLKNLESVIVAFSGGVDSSVVAYAAHLCLKDRSIAVTIENFLIPKNEIRNAKKIAKEIGIKHLIVKNEIDENILKNPFNRCYFCKKAGIKILKEIAKKYKIKAIVDGTNADDLKDRERYGIKALREEGIISPLAEVGLTKDEIREIAKEIRLPNAERPSTPCLATRIPYNELITEERIKRIEKAENFINKIIKKTAGKFFTIRVRDSNDIARIECDEECIDVLIENRREIVNELKKNYKYVVLDMEGYKKYKKI